MTQIKLYQFTQLVNDEFKKQDNVKKPNKNEKKIDRTDRNKDLIFLKY